VRAKVREHVRAVSATLPFFKRIRILQFSDGELPRTATRKVKRREVIDQIKRLQQGVGKGESTQQPAGKSDNEWLYEVVANVSGKPRSRVELDTRLDQLGFDSLMYTELAVALEAAGASLVGTDDVMAIGDMRELVASVRRGAPSATAHGATAHGTTSHGTTSHWAASSVVEGSRALLRVGAGGPAQDDEMQEIPVPSLVAELGTKVLGRGQRWLYDNLLDCSFEGRAHIPRHTNFIVASNHCSHLDTGLIKMALEDAGDNLCALAATDYFFDTPLKRAYFENFTNLVPMDRSGSLKRSLRQALDLLRQGHSLLIFPEGTRSMTGRIESFKASLGYLAMHGRVGILPIHVQGTLEALPKGTALLKSRRVGANIGRLVTCEQLQLLTAGLPRSDGYRLVSSAVQHVVEAMRDGEPGILDIEQERARWNEQRQNDPVPAEQEHRQREQPSAREERR